MSHKSGVTDTEISLLLPDSFLHSCIPYIHSQWQIEKKKKLKLIKVVIKEENPICCRSWQSQAWANPKQGQGQSSSPCSIESSSWFLLGCVISNNWACDGPGASEEAWDSMSSWESVKKDGVRVCGVSEWAEPFWGSRSGACSEVLSFLPFIHMVPDPILAQQIQELVTYKSSAICFANSASTQLSCLAVSALTQTEWACCSFPIMSYLIIFLLGVLEALEIFPHSVFSHNCESTVQL